MTAPIRLASNRPPERFYRGGARISAFRGEPPAGEREPEDWVGSTTALHGEDLLGVTVLPDGRPLPEAIAADPEAWLGAAHVARWGTDARLLVKLLDAGQRLPVHAHPDDAFAAARLGRAHGKAEAWYILEGGVVHLGLRHDVAPAMLADLVARQDAGALLGLLHEIPVAPGDVIWVPPGELHAIGAGVLLLELQQPEDLSILLEWQGFAIDGASEGHLGLGFGVALDAVSTAGRTDAELASLVRHAPRTGSVLPSDADGYFRLERVAVDGVASLPPGYGILVVVAGSVTVGSERHCAGSTLLIPAGAGALRVQGEADVLLARPPRPED